MRTARLALVRLIATAVLALVLAGCTDSDTDTPALKARSVSEAQEYEDWKAFEFAAPSFEGATDAERERFISTTCDILAANDGAIASAVDEVDREFGDPGTTRAGRLILHSARWKCPEHLVDARLWAESAGLIEPDETP